jgi:hypothetical protein
MQMLFGTANSLHRKKDGNKALRNCETLKTDLVLATIPVIQCTPAIVNLANRLLSKPVIWSGSWESHRYRLREGCKSSDFDIPLGLTHDGVASLKFEGRVSW